MAHDNPHYRHEELEEKELTDGATKRLKKARKTADAKYAKL